MRIRGLGARRKRNKPPESQAEPGSDRPILAVSDRADARARRFERLARKRRNRKDAIIIDNETGHAIGNLFRGTRHGVRFTDTQLQELRGRILSHNHPDG